MCKELLQELRECNAELDADASLEDQVALLFTQCKKTRDALRTLAKGVIRVSKAQAQDREDLDTLERLLRRFTTDLPKDDE